MGSGNCYQQEQKERPIWQSICSKIDSETTAATYPYRVDTPNGASRLFCSGLVNHNEPSLYQVAQIVDRIFEVVISNLAASTLGCWMGKIK